MMWGENVEEGKDRIVRLLTIGKEMDLWVRVARAVTHGTAHKDDLFELRETTKLEG